MVLDIYRETRTYPPEERDGLQAQTRRASVSVPSNLVEGSARRGNVEYLNFLQIACASAFEPRYLLDLAFRLELLSPAVHEMLVPRLTHLCKSLVRLVIALEHETAKKKASPPTPPKA